MNVGGLGYFIGVPIADFFATYVQKTLSINAIFIYCPLIKLVLNLLEKTKNSLHQLHLSVL